jgi:hypothetical protein
VETIEDESREITFKVEDGQVGYLINNKPAEWDSEGIAALLEAQDQMKLPVPVAEGKAYTRQGMMNRVLAERKEKSLKALYKIKFAKNIYGEHELINEKGTKFFVLLRDFENETGYINNPDWQTKSWVPLNISCMLLPNLKKIKHYFASCLKLFPI